MNAKGKFSLILAAAMAVSITGCQEKSTENFKEGYGTDIAKEYGKYLKYAFDGDYTITLTDQKKLNDITDTEVGMSSWTLTCKNGDGEEYEDHFYSEEYKGRNAECFTSEKAMNDHTVLSLVTVQMNRKAEAEFAKNILSKHMDTELSEASGCWESNEADITLYISNILINFDETPVTAEHVTAGKGYKYTDADLKSVMNDSDFYLDFTITVDDDEEAEKYLPVIEAIQADFEEYTGTPQNYSFSLRKTDATLGTVAVYEKSYTMCEEYNGPYNNVRELTDRYCEMYGIVRD